MRSDHSPRRNGLTLVEVLVALLLFASAALTTAAVHGATSRLSSEAVIRRRLADAAASTLDSLRSIPCAAVATGASTTPQGTLRWVVSAAARTHALDLVVTPARGAPWSASTVIPC